jgi:gas vesicle protein GvpL/GvpF
MALRLHAITLAEVNHKETVPNATTEWAALGPTMRVPYRDLCAIVSQQKAFLPDDEPGQHADSHRAIVDALFRHTAVLPAPLGVVFRAPDVLTRWMELHYMSLTNALQFVDDRAVARVHVVRADGKAVDAEAGSDLASAAAESVRALRRRAVASVPLRLEEVTGLVLSAAFLVERDSWKTFVDGVAEQQEAHQLMRFDVTGPWAPYDFVRMQFEG